MEELTAGRIGLAIIDCASDLRKPATVRGKDMNIRRFVIPATVATAVHAALFYAVPDTITPTRLVAVTQVDFQPPIPPDDKPPMIDPPKTADTDATKEVRVLSTGEERPELPHKLLDTGPMDIAIPLEDRPIKKFKDTEKIGPPGELGGTGLGDWNGGGPGIFSLDKLDKTPRATVRMPPVYPATLKKDGIEGVVLIEFDVDAKGRVVSARVRESTNRAFDEPTLRAVRNWRFEPGLRQGRPVSFRMVIPVNFKLGED